MEVIITIRGPDHERVLSVTVLEYGGKKKFLS